jgi:serine/threonine protein kinase/formylglycine-generating enzyme required for sulfatase activity/cephalosporin-C deacetylase-like acetyl esterase
MAPRRNPKIGVIASPQKWEAAKTLFEAVLEQDPTHRSSFLQSRCADASVRAEVERLLAEHAQAASFLSSALFGNFPPKHEVLPHRLRQDELVAGRFRIVRFIAAGGMGEVYQAEDEELREQVALKTIRPDILAQPDAIARFKQEVHLARKVTHPNVCRIFDLFRHTRADGKALEETIFVSMELLNGKSLDVRLKEAGPMGTKEALPIVRSIASALSAAHALGIVHRDLKPGNIVLVNADETKVRPVVTDFGLAIQDVISDAGLNSPPTHLFVGTPAYMSPEQLEGRPATPASDIYAFGLLIYEMVTGARPFEGDTPVSAALKRLSERPIPPRKLAPALEPVWESAILRCLERDPAKRFASAKEIESSFAEASPSPTTGTNVKALAENIRRPVIAIPVVLFLLIVAVASAWWLQRSSRIQWAREQAVPQIAELIQNEQFGKAYSLTLRAERYIPNDPILTRFWPDVSWSAPIKTDPPGVSVFRRDYNQPGAKWEFVGLSPIENRRFAPVDSQWKFELKGFATVERATFASDPPDSLTVTMDKQVQAPPGMVHIEIASSAPPQSTSVKLFGLPGFEKLPAVPLRDFWIDKDEVTNAEFKRFLDEGGYQHRRYWKFSFRKDGHILSWTEAMAVFHDRTGRPGPATWVQGSYPSGQEDYPVTGVSWFEAAAYAAFVGKSLPTIYHWTAAASPWDSPSILPASNFVGVGPARVGSYGGMTWAGAYDMAGNVKEWVLNQAYAGKRYIMGGAWDEPTYMFNEPDARSPFQRAANFGFRCAQFTLEGNALKAADPVTLRLRNFSREKPVSDQLFEAYKGLYSYDKTPLHSVVESTQKAEDWNVEKIRFDAAYGNDRVAAYLFLPSKVLPPFQTVVYFPGAGAIYVRSSTEVLPQVVEDFDFIVNSGRAVLFPLYKGTFERADGYQVHRHTSSYRDHVIYWSKDLDRSIDYLETRPDIDHNKLAYEGFSWGAAMGAILPAVENRIKALVLIAPGFYLEKCPPEVDQLNFAPRVKAPVLMLNGRFDFIFPPGSSQEPMFRLLGTPNYEKRRVVYDTGHNIPRNEMIKETLQWLDRYLGPVK